MILRAWTAFLIIWGALYLVYEFSSKLTLRERNLYGKIIKRVGLTGIAVSVIITLYIQLF